MRVLGRQQIWGAAAALALVVTLTGCGPPPPDLEEPHINAAQAVIKAYSEVEEATVVQDGRKVSLSLTVVSGVSEADARELAESFVILVQLIGPESPPESGLGEGIYDYHVQVYGPGSALIVEGRKRPSSSEMSW